MTLYLENETERSFGFAVKETAARVMEEVLARERCPYEASVNLLLTDNAQIRELNRKYRGIDSATDVLSFPNISYGSPADFSGLTQHTADCFEPDTGELVLGDIVVSADKVTEQAENYGHSAKREFAFLVAHSMLHLLGYDHMTKEEAAVMEEKQERALLALGITRDDTGKR